jgi:hypothetical protein
MGESMDADNWSEALNIGLSWLESCPVDLRIHFYTAISLSELDRESDAEVHLSWVNGLMGSVLESGDGRAPDTAFVTISIYESYDVIYLSRFTPVEQALIQGEVTVDAHTVRSEDGDEFVIYFNPAAHFSRLIRMFE